MTRPMYPPGNKQTKNGRPKWVYAVGLVVGLLIGKFLLDAVQDSPEVNEPVRANASALAEARAASAAELMETDPMGAVVQLAGDVDGQYDAAQAAAEKYPTTIGVWAMGRAAFRLAHEGDFKPTLERRKLDGTKSEDIVDVYRLSGGEVALTSVDGGAWRIQPDGRLVLADGNEVTDLTWRSTAGWEAYVKKALPADVEVIAKFIPEKPSGPTPVEGATKGPAVAAWSTGTQIAVQNVGTDALTGCEVYLNRPALSSKGFEGSFGRIEVGSTLTLGLLQFTDKDGRRFNLAEFVVKRISVSCREGSWSKAL